jgi:aminopeptidase N
MALRNLLLAALLLAGCSKREDSASQERPIPASEAIIVPRHVEPQPDRFSYANFSAVRATHLALDLDVDFDKKVLSGSAMLSLVYADPSERTLVLDTDDLVIRSVEAESDGAFVPVRYELAPDDPVLGSKLTIALPEGSERVRIAYATSPGAQGLQWLDPKQTTSRRPFLYSQAQAIHARSIAPVQDTPAVRITYSAAIRPPQGLVAVMSAEADADGPQDGEYRFHMPQPIPPYLIAIAVGDLRFAPISDKIGVWTEPSVAEAAAREFADTPKMMDAAEALYGPYRWGRYDMLVLPPSFPFGGMENPRVTFLTPTLLAGDKSLVATVAHELAHSWSGNLVTNARWRDSWLNEGVTSYVENRLMEAIYGRERAVMEQELALEDWKRADSEAERPELTQLLLPADLKHPDDAFSRVAYNKGEFFLRFLEERFGREQFDAFLRRYFDAFAFKTLTTDDFRAYLEKEILAQHPDAVTKAELDEWLYAPGLPKTTPIPRSAALEKVIAEHEAFISGAKPASALPARAWTTQEWLRFLNALPDDAAPEKLAELDIAFQLSGAGNAEIASAWYLKAIASGYEPAMDDIEAFLKRVGRGKFIYRLYGALADNGRKDFAVRIYQEARPSYHPIAQRRIDEILK